MQVGSEETGLREGKRRSTLGPQPPFATPTSPSIPNEVLGVLPRWDDSLGHGERLQPTVGLRAAPSPRRPPDAHSGPTPGSSRSRTALVRRQRGFGRRSQCSPWSRHATTPSANWVARSSASPSARRSCHEGAVVVAPERHDGGPCASALQDFAPGPGTMVAHGRSIAVAKSWIAAASRPGRSVVS